MQVAAVEADKVNHHAGQDAPHIRAAHGHAGPTGVLAQPTGPEAGKNRGHKTTGNTQQLGQKKIKIAKVVVNLA